MQPVSSVGSRSASSVTATPAGLLTLRTEISARWTGIVALVGGVSFVITFLVVLEGTTDGSSLGYGFFPGAIALVTWTAAAW